jgi:hypothetical protein
MSLILWRLLLNCATYIPKQQSRANLSLCLITVKHYALNTYGGSGGIAPLFFTKLLDEDEWSASYAVCFTSPGKEPSLPIWIRGSVDPRAGLDAVAKSLVLPGIESNSSRPRARRYTDLAVPFWGEETRNGPSQFPLLRSRVTLVAGLLLSPAAQKLCGCEYRVLTRRTWPRSRNVTSHGNRPLLFAKHLAVPKTLTGITE